MALLGNKLQQAYSATAKDTFNGDGSTVAFTLSRPSRTNDVEVFVENVQQEPTVAYAVSGTTLTFTEAPASGTGNIYVIHRTQATQSLTVNTDDITDGAITAAKIASGVIPEAVTKSASDPATTTNGTVGDLWLNTTTGELYCLTDATTNNNVWTNVGDGSGVVAPSISATGGTTVESGGYKYHTFTSSGTFTVSNAGYTGAIEYLIVAGGGGGGHAGARAAGGGGAGGYLTGSTTVTAQAYSIVVGAGGLGGSQVGNYQAGEQGENSTAFSLTAIGGGGGGSEQQGVQSGGGSGGGAGQTGSYGLGTSGQGYDGGDKSGYEGGGGGGAGAVGATASPGNGGIGLNTQSAWATATSTGDSGYYAGGGGGAGNTSEGTGGLGGGGNGDYNGGTSGGAAENGQANTGGGGGGHGWNGTSGNGGSGIVIIRYAV